MNKDKALELALEALEFDGFMPEDLTHRSLHAKAITAIKQALAAQPAPVAKPHEQEPIAYLHQCGKKPELKELSFKKNEPLLAAKGYKAIPLTSPPAQRKPLTDEQAHQILLDMAKHIETFGPEDITEQQLSAECVRFICQRVAAHGITKGQPILEQALAAPVQEPVAWVQRATEWLLDLPKTPLDYPYFTNGMFKNDCHSLAEALQGYTPPAAQPAPVQEPVKNWCETCNGSGKVYQEHQAGCWVGGEHDCPDCDGKENT
jgi:hypothetical protein